MGKVAVFAIGLTVIHWYLGKDLTVGNIVAAYAGMWIWEIILVCTKAFFIGFTTAWSRRMREVRRDA